MFKIKQHLLYYILAALALAAGFVWSAVFWAEAHRGRVIVHFFDVGQGDAMLIEAPGGNQVLIDGGPDSTVLARLGEAMPFWDRSLDLILLTHPHADHLDGLLEVLRRYEVGMVLESGVNHSIPEYSTWHEELERRHIPVVTAARGEVVRIGGGAVLQVLSPFRSFVGESPKNIHDAAMVTRLAYASSTVLFMADAEATLERQLVTLPDTLGAQVLKVGHHGSRVSTSEEFLRVVRPEAAVISVGRENRFGHPHQDIVDRLARFGIKTYRTDTDGTVTFATSGGAFSRK